MFGCGLQIKILRIEAFRVSSSYKHRKLDAYVGILCVDLHN